MLHPAANSQWSMPSQRCKGQRVLRFLRVWSVWRVLRVPWKAKKEPWKTKPSDKTFRRKTYLPKACNFHVQMPGSLNWRTKHARKMFTRYGLGAAWWLRDGFDRGKRRSRSSTPAVVPGAAPALAKAGVGGFWISLKLKTHHFFKFLKIP